MSNPIGNAGSSPTPGVGGAQANSGANAPSSVSSGFSADNSVSHASGSSAGGSGGVSLDSPGESLLNSRNYLAQAVQTKLEALKAVVALNNDMPTNEIDLSDTQNLLLSLRGVLNDIRVVSSAATLDIRAMQFQQNKQIANNTPARVEEMRQGVKETQHLIDTVQKQIKSYQDKGAGEDVIAPLRAQLAIFEAKKQGQEARIGARQAMALVANVGDSILRELSVMPVRTASKSSLHTGEEELDELKRELQVLEKRFAKEDVRAVLASRILGEMNRDLTKESDRYSAKALEKGATQLPQAIPEMLPPKLVKNLFRFLMPQNLPELPAVKESEAPSEQAISNAAEGLALVIAARVDSDVPDKRQPENTKSQNDRQDMSETTTTDVSVPASTTDVSIPASTAMSTGGNSNAVSEENPVDQPILGDNLSLEGANNPQAFTLLLLRERMADIEEALNKNVDGAVADSIGANQLAQLLEQEQRIDVMVAEALKDSERSEEAIRRASKA